MNEAHYDRLCKERDDVLYKARVQSRYHRRRQRFFDFLDKSTTALTIGLGVSLFGQFFQNEVVAACLAMLGFLALIYCYSDRKHEHKQLAERANDLVSRIAAVPSDNLTAEQTAAWFGEFWRFAEDCPPSLETLTRMCEREQSVADGHKDHVPKPHGFWRLLCYFV